MARPQPFLALASFFYAVYLGTAPVYWLPLVPLSIWNYAKVGLILGAIFFTIVSFLDTKRHQQILSKQIILFFLALMIAAAPGLLLGRDLQPFSFMIDIAMPFIFMLSFYIFVRAGGRWKNVLKASSLIIAIFSMLSASSSFLGFPHAISPFGASFSISNAGFGGLRTGWSNGIALYLPLLIGFGLRENSSRFVSFIYFAGAFAILIAQYGVGGRAGLFASALAIILLLITYRKYALLGIVFIGSLITFSIPNIRGPIMTNLRIQADVASEIDLDTVSSGRIGPYLEAFHLITQKPIWGHGVGVRSLPNNRTSASIHNIWLRFWVDLGVVFVLVFLHFIFFLHHQYNRVLKDSRITMSPFTNVALYKSLGVVLVVGVFISLLEPSTLIGAFQNIAMWWAIGGIIIAEADLSVHKRKRCNISAAPL